MASTRFRSASRFAAVGLVLLIAGVVAPVASAQATRTWVSGVGDDANPCSRTAPCRTFAGAISKTGAGGEISVLDPGGYGAVTITKAMTIDGGGTFAGITSSGTNGIVVNANGANVVLRNIEINGVGTGLSGIRMVGPGTLHVYNVHIRSVGAGSSPAINVVPTSGTASVVLSDVVIENCANTGVSLKGTTGSARAILNRVLVSNCATALAVEGSAVAQLSDSTLLVPDNGAACNVLSGGTIESFQNNRLDANCVVTPVAQR